MTISDPQPGIYYFTITDAGTCHITVSFQSGAQHFVTDVKTMLSTGCCAGPFPEVHGLAVPEPANGPSHT